jgi:hypothetical protein
MSLKKINLRNGALVFMIVCAAATRLINVNHLSVWSNFTPVGAVSLFGGAYFSDKWKAYLVPLLTLFISDIALDYVYFNKFMLFYNGALPVYISFALMVFIGTYIKKVNVGNVLAASLAAVFVHWIITDIDPWLSGTLYAKSLYGYGESLIAAIPFEKNMLLGNLLFSAILFGGFELAQRKFTVLRVNKELAV